MVGGGGEVRGRRRRRGEGGGGGEKEEGRRRRRGGGGDILLKLSKQSIKIQNKGARDMLNKHGILLTENLGRTLDYQISYLAIANVWGRSAVAYGLTCSQACYHLDEF